MRWPWTRSKAATPEPPTAPSGVDGVPAYGGFLLTGERDPRLSGREKWITFDNMMLNIAIISAAVNIWTQLGGSAGWTVEPNKRGGADAKAAADLVYEGLIASSMSTPWRQVVRRQLMKKFHGFALQEIIMRRRDDGVYVVGDILYRPQSSVWRWDKLDERTPWVGVEQLTITGTRAYMERERLFYSVENTLSASPEGVGLFRMMAESVRVLQIYQQLEGIGMQIDLRGMPITRAPLAQLREQAGNGKTAAEIQAYVQSQVQFMLDFLANHNKRPDQGIVLDSAVYRDKGAVQTPSSQKLWDISLAECRSSGMKEIGIAIGGLKRDIARVMCAEWLLLGGDDSGGAYSMHEDKTAMFGLIVNSALDDVGDDATRDIARRMVAWNGYDPERCTPKMIPEPIASGSLKDACDALKSLYSTELPAGDPVRNVLRQRANLPPEPTGAA